MANYSINVTNGVGTENVKKGSYSVTASVTGYDNTSIDPASITITDETEYTLTVGATGTLTLHVTEDGTESGTPIVGAEFYRTDENGVTYGNVITTNSEGNAIFNNVPYDVSGFTFYYKQTASDATHDFDDTVKELSLSTESTIEQVANPAPTVKTFKLNDANYDGLPIGSGTIDLA